MAQILQGQAIAFFAFDIGYEVSLDKVGSLLASLPVKPLSRKKKTPNYLQYSYAPHTVYVGEKYIGLDTKAQIYATIFDFGAVSISYRWPLTQNGRGVELAELPVISKTLFDSALEPDAKAQVETLMKRIHPAIVKPDLSSMVEDYFVFVLEKLDVPFSAQAVLEQHRSILAQTLRFDTEPLSVEQQEEALAKPISYYERDMVLIDWNAAVIYDQDYVDTINVLELLNVELLEARYIDGQLDKRIRDYDGLLETRTRFLIPFYSPYRSVIRELAELRIESSLMAERVENALKLIGDLYLARVHLAASERFNMHEWDKAISRKLDIIGNLYQLLTDRLSTSQAQTLELIIILLILIEILMGIFSR